MAKSKLFPDIPNEIERYDPVLDDIVRGRKVVIDMGCGHGDYMIEFAPRHPDTLFIGIELQRKRAHKAAHRLAKRNIENFRMIVASGEDALSRMFPSNSADELHINFPEPWMRERYWKTRILRPAVLIHAARVLKPGGILSFVTDIDIYAAYASETMSRFPFFRNNYDRPYMVNIYEKFPTLFYRKMSLVRPIHYVSYTRNGEMLPAA
ncbi:MAG: hypothetical protein A2Y33_00210 [Spirochaetes bacterium GWF1_51_8]|nr:MAG: hypothetical protein A2Y33_00210 [Spirochaetes bacterium GWF1_51_8]